MFKDAIKALMELIIEDIKNLSLDSGLLASITRDNAYATIWSHVTSIASGAFRTCAFIVLLIFIMIEFLELSDRFSSNQLPDLLKPFSILIIKLALSITIINQSTTILNTIYNGFLDLSTQVNVTSSITMTTDLTNFNNFISLCFGYQNRMGFYPNTHYRTFYPTLHIYRRSSHPYCYASKSRMVTSRKRISQILCRRLLARRNSCVNIIFFPVNRNQYGHRYYTCQ